ncbi:ras-related C3 botulinum toxin substrate 1-like [Bolinopsis microptera]|uniref:ras-related C3 botulinum toxin substrate 1-like n=1 Tax=Bolinopsis microptera TaxID=2820187 RepID=UPI00307A7C2E
MVVVLIKTITVGYGNVGKTSLLITYTTGQFPSEYTPTVFDNYSLLGNLDARPYNLALWDTGGGEDYERLRPLSYPQTDVFILLFSASDNEDRFEQIHSYWWVELNHHCPDVPIVLVGSKIDLRNKDGIQTVTTEEGQAMAEKIGAAKYMEISSLENRGVGELFEEVIRLGFDHSLTEAKKEKKTKKCVIL